MRRQREQHRTDGEQRPLLVDDRDPEYEARPGGAPADREKHRDRAQRRPQELLGVPEAERLVGDGVCCAQQDRRGCGGKAAAAAAQLAREPDAECAQHEQARQRGEAEDQQLSAPGQASRQGERRSQHERAAIGGGLREEGPDVAVQQCPQRLLGLRRVIVLPDVPRPVPEHPQRCRARHDAPPRGLAAEHARALWVPEAHVVAIGAPPAALDSWPRATPATSTDHLASHPRTGRPRAFPHGTSLLHRHEGVTAPTAVRRQTRATVRA